MAIVDLIMPKLGESIMEATILQWHKKVGEAVALDETILEIATDKVDTEIPSPVAGHIKEILFGKDDIVAIGTVIATIETGTEEGGSKRKKEEPIPLEEKIIPPSQKEIKADAPISNPQAKTNSPEKTSTSSDRFYSPLVLNIARREKISMRALDLIEGTGLNGRVTKKDLLNFIEQGNAQPIQKPYASSQSDYTPPASPISTSENVEIIEMDRMRRLIADHMVYSKRTAPHVTSFVEADVTDIVNWRNKIKASFKKKYGQNITFTPIFIEAVVKALRDYPFVNVSVVDNKIILKKDINIGMATALPSGNLIVPVIKHADSLNLLGLTKSINDLADRARKSKLKPEEIQDGTFTVTNVGSFGNVMGTPIINQPQVAILATGAVRKLASVLETDKGDVIAIRSKVFLSLSYDHRVVDGALGGSFLRKVADYLEEFDINQSL